MKTFGIFLGALTLFAGIAQGQVPGDGFPDVYYFPADDLMVETSEGPITRPAGTLTVDTDGLDMVALLVAGPDLSDVLLDPACTPADGLCDDGVLWANGNPAIFGDIQDWAAGFIGGSMQWLRTNPLDVLGFEGVVGAPDPNGDPFGIYPDFGMGNYGPGLTADNFPLIFSGPNGSGNFIFATDDGRSFTGRITGVPEPTSLGLFSLAGLAAARMLRRKKK